MHVTSKVANKLKPKSREMPEAHPAILDDISGEVRECNSSKEMLEAT